MINEPAVPWVFRVQLEHTPSLNDPEGAADFYQALGTMVVAWSRLETHFLACVLNILATEATKGRSQKFPMAWDERTRIWKEAFCVSPALKQYEARALAFLAEIKEVQDDRNMLVHGFWEPFDVGVPVRSTLVVVRHKKGTINGVSHWRGTISTNHIIEVTQKADRLNIGLQMLSGILSVERGHPPPFARTL